MKLILRDNNYEITVTRQLFGLKYRETTITRQLVRDKIYDTPIRRQIS